MSDFLTLDEAKKLLGFSADKYSEEELMDVVKGINTLTKLLAKRIKEKYAK